MEDSTVTIVPEAKKRKAASQLKKTDLRELVKLTSDQLFEGARECAVTKTEADADLSKLRARMTKIKERVRELKSRHERDSKQCQELIETTRQAETRCSAIHFLLESRKNNKSN
jgi:archaellum component FlaC